MGCTAKWRSPYGWSDLERPCDSRDVQPSSPLSPLSSWLRQRSYIESLESRDDPVEYLRFLMNRGLQTPQPHESETLWTPAGWQSEDSVAFIPEVEAFIAGINWWSWRARYSFWWHCLCLEAHIDTQIHVSCVCIVRASFVKDVCPNSFERNRCSTSKSTQSISKSFFSLQVKLPIQPYFFANKACYFPLDL